MTEADWLSCSNPKPMLLFLGGRATDRKMRLLACAGCRRVLDFVTDGRIRDAVEIAERFADGLIGDEERETAYRIAFDAYEAEWKAFEETYFKEEWDSRHSRICASGAAAECAAPDPPAGKSPVEVRDFNESYWNSHLLAQLAECNPKWAAWQAETLRELFGNPFRPSNIAPAWQTPSVVSLAQAIYDQRSFDRLSELAYTLEEAGCHDTGILEHLWTPGPHVKGCWALDLVLGKL